MALVKKQVYISKELNDWLIAECKETGLTQSALNTLALMEYRKHKETIKMLTSGKLNIMFEELKELAKNIDGTKTGQDSKPD